MKKYITLAILATSLIFTSCDPMKDIYKDIDSKETAVKKTASYELTGADYNTIAGLLGADNPHAAAFKAKQAFDKNVTAQEMVPQLLKSKYPEWGKGSSVNVTYNEVLPIDSKIEALGKRAYVTLDKNELSALGINSLKDLKADQITAIIKAAIAKADSAKSILIRATIDKENKLLFAVDGALAGKDYLMISWEEFTQMGLGRHGNFSPSAKPEDYIPTLLAQKYPYAKEGDSHIMIYAFYNPTGKTTSTEAVKYEKKNKVWTPAPTVHAKTSQFIHTGKAWIFDPTIEFELTPEDFAYLHAWVKENHPGYISERYKNNEEYWFGGSGYYKNFNLDGGKTVGERPEEEGKTPEELRKIKLERIIEGLKMVLAHRYPTNPAQINGIDQMYKIRVEIREKSANTKWLYTFKGLGSGKFQLEGKPEQI
ncbi:hypothetical protein [Porphyromonas sp.]|uniref:hypothetical protein n=1 Tax=Porphyromonas sp. TaxID=1924944 RepID=UPI0026DC5661|nr:hypothetical protein [Porphyromonas sp.]MDO4695352.1 hypothetical protein [Porphyromonas sp.]MDO4770353.1 hypothetical protein [Porphyromonas sp.]